MTHSKKSQAETLARTVDTMAERLIAAGIQTNEWLLDLNGCLTTPDSFSQDGIWKLPSRLFSFPIQVSRFDGVNERTLTLRHPLLSAHPFVQHVESALGVKLEAPETAEAAETWFHACDLIEDHWQGLMETRQFTTDSDIGRAIAFGLRAYYRSNLKVQAARKMLAQVGIDEPADPVALLFKLAKPLSLTDTAVRWPINGTERLEGGEQAWTLLVGLERGWFGYVGGCLSWTQSGRDRYAAGPEALFVQCESGQAAFDF